MPSLPQFQMPKLWLWSWLAGKLFMHRGDFWNKVHFWFARLQWSVPHYLHATGPNTHLFLILTQHVRSRV